MRITLNEKQIEGLADFLFDIAKGLILGILGTAVVSNAQIAIVFIGGSFAAFCIVVALRLLGRL